MYENWYQIEKSIKSLTEFLTRLRNLMEENSLIQKTMKEEKNVCWKRKEKDGLKIIHIT